jgi:hypothetical protein
VGAANTDMLGMPTLAEPTLSGELALNASPANDPGRILVVGRSPSVLVGTVEILRSKGYSADATNQFDHVLDDYDAQDIGIVVFGGMVPADTKHHLGQQIGQRNADVTFVQGLAGIAGLIAAQVEGEPKSTSMQVLDTELQEGSHSISLPAEVPSVASFLAVTIGSAVRTFTVGAMPQSVMRMVPNASRSAVGSPPPSSQLPPVSEVNTRSHDR